MTETSALIQYDIACQALAKARSVDEVKDIRDKSDALRHYARQAKNKDLEIDAAEIRIRAEHRLGEMLLEQKATLGMNTGAMGIGTSAVPTENRTPTLADVGIDKKLSMRSQKLASVPHETFEGMMDEWRERVNREHERVTVDLLKENARCEKDERIDSQQTASIHYLHQNGAYIEDFESIVKAVQSGLQEPYGCIYADPPWAYENQGTRASTGNPGTFLDSSSTSPLPSPRLRRPGVRIAPQAPFRGSCFGLQSRQDRIARRVLTIPPRRAFFALSAG